MIYYTLNHYIYLHTSILAGWFSRNRFADRRADELITSSIFPPLFLSLFLLFLCSSCLYPFFRITRIYFAKSSRDIFKKFCPKFAGFSRATVFYTFIAKKKKKYIIAKLIRETLMTIIIIYYNNNMNYCVKRRKKKEKKIGPGRPIEREHYARYV